VATGQERETMINTVLLIQILVIALIVEVIALQTIQMVKGYIPNSRAIPFVSLVLNLMLASAFVWFFVSFEESYPLYKVFVGLWVGFISWIGADTLYKTLNSKGLLKSQSELLPQDNEKSEGTE